MKPLVCLQNRSSSPSREDRVKAQTATRLFGFNTLFIQGCNQVVVLCDSLLEVYATVDSPFSELNLAEFQKCKQAMGQLTVLDTHIQEGSKPFLNTFRTLNHLDIQSHILHLQSFFSNIVKNVSDIYSSSRTIKNPEEIKSIITYLRFQANDLNSICSVELRSVTYESMIKHLVNCSEHIQSSPSLESKRRTYPSSPCSPLLPPCPPPSNLNPAESHRKPTEPHEENQLYKSRRVLYGESRFILIE